MIEASTLFTSHWRNPELCVLDATIIGISRGTPRGNPGFRYRLLRSLAPSRETFAIQDRRAFEAAYLAQLDALGIERILSDLERVGGTGSVVMLCWERPGAAFCHRWLLADWLREQTGIVVPELQPGDLPQREGAPQPALFDYREERVT